ncbi:hypothetical protein [Obesumbacterium proteus]|uniref:hypothetical protein n=1 Tax=Obesumbacterium proteus TaxID=82983 RepID=UPI00242BB65F|nr:hypothetical protein [Obesumbacterium proteus]
MNIPININKALSPATAILAVIAVTFPFFALFKLPLAHGVVVQVIEDVQSVWLLFGAIFTWFYMKPLTLAPRQKAFWCWATVWWVVLFGRGISWGRDFFPETPKIYFRIISVILIGTLLLMLLLPALRKEIAERVKHQSIPLWTVLLMVVCFLISDTIEHHRLLAPIFIRDSHYQDLLEELYELPFMLCLFDIALGIMRSDKKTLNQENIALIESYN